VLLVVATMTMAAAHTTMALATSSSLLTIGFALCGAAFGMTPGLLFMILSDFFGVKHLGSNYGMIEGFGQACGGSLGLVWSYLSFYRRHVNSGDCAVPSCFKVKPSFA